MDDLKQITFLGKTDFRNQMTQFGIRAKDRFRHMYVIGKSGTGKTTLLENMIVQDIYNGNGVAFIDPHGESADKLLRYIPTHRIEDVIYFSPGDSEFPIAFNPLEISDSASSSERSLIADGLMTVFKKIWPEAFSGRMEYILNNSMLALLEYPDSTLLSINRMLTDKDFRKKVIASVTDPTVRNAWDELSKWDDKRWSEAIGALVNKIGQFTTNPIARNIIGQTKSTFNFREAMDARKIIIVNLSKGLIGEESAKLIGALLITKIYLSAMSRANLSPEELAIVPPLYFYVDEFQNFANDSFANILSEARKYKLALTVANQFIAQMEDTIKDAVFGNMGSIISFRVGPFDAEFLEKVYSPIFTTEDLQNIGFGQCFLTLLIDGMSSRPFSAATLGPIQPQEPPQMQRVIDSSRSQYTRPRKEVEEKIMAWFNEQRPTVIKKSTEQPPSPQQKFIPQEKKKTPFEISKKTPLHKISAVQPVMPPRAKDTTIATNSPMINNLLDKLEMVPDVQVDTHKPVTSPESVNTSPQVMGNKINKMKDKSASVSTKNSLLEVLQKVKNIQSQESQQKSVKNDIPLKEVIKTAVADNQDKHSTNTPQQQKAMNTKKMTGEKIREVPEDILKKILE